MSLKHSRRKSKAKGFKSSSKKWTSAVPRRASAASRAYDYVLDHPIGIVAGALGLGFAVTRAVAKARRSARLNSSNAQAGSGSHSLANAQAESGSHSLAISRPFADEPTLKEKVNRKRRRSATDYSMLHPKKRNALIHAMSLMLLARKPELIDPAAINPKENAYHKDWTVSPPQPPALFPAS